MQNSIILIPQPYIGGRERFEQEGWVGLIPEYSKKGRKKEKIGQLEDLITEVIENRYLNSNQPSMASCYEYLCMECGRKV